MEEVKELQVCNHSASECDFFCSNIKCNGLLCNKCFWQHQKKHIIQEEECNIFPIAEHKNALITKIDECLQQGQKYLDLLKEFKTQFDIFHDIEKGVKVIEQAKMDIINAVEQYFQKILQRFTEETNTIQKNVQSNYEKLAKDVQESQESFKFIKIQLEQKDISLRNEVVLKNWKKSFKFEDITQKINDLPKHRSTCELNVYGLKEITRHIPYYLQITINNQRMIIDKLESQQPQEGRNSYKPQESNYSSLQNSMILTDSILMPTGNNIIDQFNNSNNSNGNNILETIPEKRKKKTFGIHEDVLQTSLKKRVDFEIEGTDYFNIDCNAKFLHFFEGGSRNLYLLNIDDLALSQNKTPKFQKIEIDNDFIIPYRHRSIITPRGDLYLTGGILEENKVLSTSYRYDHKQNHLIPLQNLRQPRKSHGICYLNHYVYLIGGSLTDTFSSKCERILDSSDSQKWQLMADLKKACSSPAICTYKNRYIFKFGGLSVDEDDTHALNNSIERYDPETNVWTQFEYQHIESLKAIKFRIMWLASAVQINSNQIYVFGGCDHDDTFSTQSFLMSLEEKTSTGFMIKKYNTLEMPKAGGFWCCQSIVQNGVVFAIQNVVEQNGKEIKPQENKRSVLIFDGEKWKLLVND